ncbi:MAG: hypothetical protein R3E67_06825 [Pseudomonadales bacterium]
MRQLLARGCDVTLLHRGVHRATAPDSVARIQADPYAKDGLSAALAGKRFDAAIATYGRLRFVAQQLIGVTERLISVGGAAPVYKGWGEMMAQPLGNHAATPFLAEDHPLAPVPKLPILFYSLCAKPSRIFCSFSAMGISTSPIFATRWGVNNNICPAEWG